MTILVAHVDRRGRIVVTVEVKGAPFGGTVYRCSSWKQFLRWYNDPFLAQPLKLKVRMS